MIKINKMQRVKESLLQGHKLTGKHLMLEYQCLAYRNVIYRLRKQGLCIQTKMIGKSKYAIYWMELEDIKQYNQQIPFITTMNRGVTK